MGGVMTNNWGVFSSATQFGLAQYDIGTGTGTLNIEDENLGGATPNFALVIQPTHRRTNDPSNSGNMGVSIGMTDGSTTVGAMATSVNDSAGSNSERGNSNYVTGTGNNTGGFDNASAFSSFAPDRLTINRTNAAGLNYTGFASLMALSDTFVGTQNLGTGTSPIDITSVGFEAKAFIFLKAGDNDFSAPAVDTNNMNLEIGFAVNDGSDTQACVAWANRDNDGTGASRLGIWTDRCLQRLSAFNGSQLWNITAGSFDAAGLSLTPNASATNQEVGFAALQCEEAAIIVDTTPTTPSEKAYTGVGFRPRKVIILATSAESIDPAGTVSTSATLGAGLGISAFNELGVAFAASLQLSEDGANNTVACSDLKEGIALQIEDGTDRTAGGDPDVRATFVSMTDDGWKLLYDKVAAAEKYFVALALR